MEFLFFFIQKIDFKEKNRLNLSLIKSIINKQFSRICFDLRRTEPYRVVSYVITQKCAWQVITRG